MRNISALLKKMALPLAVAVFFAAPVRAQGMTENLYKAKCASCHAADGSGNTPAGKKLGAHDFRSEEVQKMTDAQLAGAIAKGKNKMPSYEKFLKPDQIKDLVAHIRKMGKP